jgi:serine/threonine protein kinase
MAQVGYDGAPMWKPGSQIGRYRVVGALGRGGPDGLFEVQDDVGRRFALRSPIGDLEDGGDAVTVRFLPVAESLRALAHLNLVVLFDVFVDHGQLFLVTECVPGRTLATAIDAGLGPRQALVIARQILDAAAHAHAGGQVHRDLQPSKILLVAMRGWELVKVADFGLGTLVDEVVLEFGADALIGSLPRPSATYMTPEQVLGRSVDARTDLYSIGVMLFEMLTGRPPFPDRDRDLVEQLHVRVPPPKLDVICRGAPWCTPEVLTLVETVLAKDREARYPDALAMQGAVDEAFASLQHLPPE